MDHGNDMTDSALAGRVRGLMPQLRAELVELVAITSVSEPGFPTASRPALLQARDAVAALFRDAGCERVGSLELLDTAPMVTAEIPVPEGARTAAVTGPRRGARAGQVMPSGLCRAGGRQLSGTASSSSMYSNGIGPTPGGRFGAT